jgi:hypothetical protein
MTEELIGYVAVDSGQLMICDPCYLSGEFSANEYSPAVANEDKMYPFTYNGVCGMTISDRSHGQMMFANGGVGAGVGFRSGLGDGMYPVYATIVNDDVWGRRIASVRIVMMEEGY